MFLKHYWFNFSEMCIASEFKFAGGLLWPAKWCLEDEYSFSFLPNVPQQLIIGGRYFIWSVCSFQSSPPVSFTLLHSNEQTNINFVLWNRNKIYANAMVASNIFFSSLFMPNPFFHISYLFVAFNIKNLKTAFGKFVVLWQLTFSMFSMRN